jgi:hypothetical protein
VNIGFFTDNMPDRPLGEILDWLSRSVPEVTRIEIGTGGYSPARHADRAVLLADPGARAR